MSAAETPIPSPLSNLPARKTLCARVVEPGWRPRLHGYDVYGDLAYHYRFAELMLTALVGETPSTECGARFSVAMCFASPSSIAEPPSHATSISRLLGTRSSDLIGVATVALCEQARETVQRHAKMFDSLEGDDTGHRTELPPLGEDAIDDEERAAVEMLRVALREHDAYTPLLDGEHTMISAILATFYSAGLRHAWQFESALCNARLPVVIAEAMAADPASLLTYPVGVPPMIYDSSPTPPRGDAAPSGASHEDHRDG